MQVPRTGSVRPTTDRVRESLFARLGPLAGSAVLDLYAGSGALGIEALSRGAARATFVDQAPAAVACIRSNLAALGLLGRATVLKAPAMEAVARLGRSGEHFGLVLADPPYASGDAARVGAAVAQAGILPRSGVLVIESDRRHPPGQIVGLREADVRRAGDTLVSRYTAELEPTWKEQS